MRPRTMLVVFSILMLMQSCKKYKHEEPQLPDCVLCDYAASIEGTYRGFVTGISAPNYGDSMNVILEQIFLGNSQYEDSTYMHFKIYYDFDSSPDTNVATIRLDNSNGNFDGDQVVATPDLVIIEHKNWTSPTTIGTFLAGTFYRQ